MLKKNLLAGFIWIVPLVTTGNLLSQLIFGNHHISIKDTIGSLVIGFVATIAWCVALLVRHILSMIRRS